MMIEKYKSEHLYEWMVEIRRKLHRHPELAFEEIETGQSINRAINQIGHFLRLYWPGPCGDW
ncbi:hippurate hydrolase/IAA-amino acid hydrolase [Nitrosomonas sp. Nm34]|nr:hippurate hydrolase/IAA-amino acid hydrolase [Nitrosomonas sp. Nm34]